MNEKINKIFSKDGLYWLIYYFLHVTHIDRFISDKIYVMLQYRCFWGKKLNLKNPKTFTEKLLWLKLYNRKPDYVQMVDKYAVKKYVADRIGEEYIIPTYGVWDKVEDINWDLLPEKFVLKCTHDSGGLVICRDKEKLDKDAAIKKLYNSLKRNYYLAGREWPYKDVPHRIIAEKYMEVEDGDLPDYKFFNFNGEPKLIEFDYDRFIDHKRNIYTANWEKTDIRMIYSSDNERVFEKPVMLDKMKDLCRILSKNIPFLRCDFYIVDNKIYFGELTFYPEAGNVSIEPEEYNELIGDWIRLPIEGKNV